MRIIIRDNNLSMALMIEAAEPAEHFQWLNQNQSRNLSDEQIAAIKNEIGDVMIYHFGKSIKSCLNPVR